MIKFDFKHAKNSRFCRQLIREILRFWQVSNVFAHVILHCRMNKLVEISKTQIENDQNIYHWFTLRLRRSKIFWFHRLQWVLVATRNQRHQAYVWRKRNTWTQSDYSWYFARNFAVFRYSHQKECYIARRILFDFCRLLAYRWVYMIWCWSYAQLRQLVCYSLLDDFLWRSSRFNAFCLEDRFISQRDLDIHCSHEWCCLRNNLTTSFVSAFLGLEVRFSVSDREIKSLQCSIRHQNTTQDDRRSETRWQLLETFLSTWCDNRSSQCKRFERFDSTFREMKVENVFAVYRDQQKLRSSNIASSSRRLSCFLFRLV